MRQWMTEFMVESARRPRHPLSHANATEDTGRRPSLLSPGSKRGETGRDRWQKVLRKYLRGLTSGRWWVGCQDDEENTRNRNGLEETDCACERTARTARGHTCNRTPYPRDKGP